MKIVCIVALLFSLLACEIVDDKNGSEQEGNGLQDSTKIEYIHSRIRDSLLSYYQDEMSKVEGSDMELQFSILFKTSDKGELTVSINSSNTPPWVNGEVYSIAGFFKFRDSKVYILDSKNEIADSLYNKERLSRIKTKKGPPPGSGYIGEIYEFKW